MPEKKSKSGIDISVSGQFKITGFNRKKLIALIKKTCALFHLRKAQINIEVADDKRIVEVNKQFLKKRSITDVISFDVSEDGEKVFDIIVNVELAKRQAKLRGHSAQAELTLYVLHGLLHQLGFDDLTKADAEKMHRIEDEILDKLGYGVVYGSAER